MNRTQIFKVTNVEVVGDRHKLTLACGHELEENLPGCGTVMRSCAKCPPRPSDRFGR